MKDKKVEKKIFFDCTTQIFLSSVLLLLPPVPDQNSVSFRNRQCRENRTQFDRICPF